MDGRAEDSNPLTVSATDSQAEGAATKFNTRALSSVKLSMNRHVAINQWRHETSSQ